ncbi:hypothetical protein ACQV2E_23655 [Pantoea allii]|uniref:hypothetical protein n=1 Tax=Pantoea TaxID=53335 RepID=UPI00049659B6|nr:MULTISPECIES: hypothetical protein [Pantoea]ORM85518.1 hypothetical protein HA38_11590 [Pantoea allii]
MKKESVSELFAGDDDWHNNACLNEWSRDHGATYAAGYRRAAELLIEHIDTKGRDQDVLVYPVVFLYRHHVELALKRIISLCLLQIDDPDVKGPKAVHDLNVLWDHARKLVRKVDPSFPRANHSNTDAVIKELIAIDSGSTAFRYDRTREGEPSLTGISLINTRLFGEKMKAACYELDCMDSYVAETYSSLLDVMSDLRYEP